MATLPKPTDYGARPSLRSNRVDLPGNADLISGEALAQAVDTFNNVMSEKKAKEDKLNYALTRNKLQQADIAAREALKDDEDWATFDERYMEAYIEARNKIMGGANISAHDRAILSSESDLILQRGRVQVGDASRIVKIDEGMDALNDGLAAARESIATEQDPETRNQILIGQLDAINAAEEAGMLDDDAARAKRENFAQDAAMASLINMNPEDREKLLEASLAWRNTNGAISVDDIRAGKGSSSIADFLPADVVKKLLTETQDENKITEIRGKAQAAVDEAFALYQTGGQAVMDEIRRLTKGDPDVRAAAEAMGTTRNVALRNYAVQERNDIMLEEGTKLESDPDYTYGDIPPERLAKLGPGLSNQLSEFDKKLLNADGFARVTNWDDEVRGPAPSEDQPGELIRPSYATWADMTPAEQAKVDLDLPMWKNNFTQPQWKAFQDQQFASINQKGTAVSPVQTNDQILQSVVVGNNLLPQTGRTPSQNAQYQRLRARFADAVVALQEREYGGAKAPDRARKNELLLLIADQAWKRDEGWLGSDKEFFWGLFGKVGPEPIFTMTPDELASGYIPIDMVRAQETRIGIGAPAGPDGTFLESQMVDSNWEVYLKNRAIAELDGRAATQKDIENAYFAVRAGMNDAEVMRRLAGKGDE